MEDAATCLGFGLARGGLFYADASRRMEMSCPRPAGAPTFDSVMVSIFAALLVFWVVIAGLIYFVA